MANRFMTSIAIAALLAGTGGALGQSAGSKEVPPSGTSTQSPSTPRSDSGSSGTLNKNQPQESTEESQRNPARSAGETPSDKQERSGTEKGKGSHTDNVRENNKNTQRQNDQMNNSQDRTNTQQRGDETPRSGSRSQTSGQAGSAKLSTEQRTKITTVIRDQRVQPEANVNFNISIGTRVPKSVRFHPLPSEIITIYPDWRGYEFFLVGDQIVVVNPRTLEIVAVLEA